MKRGSTSQTLIVCAQAEEDVNQHAFGTIWTNRKQVVLLGNVFYAATLAIGTSIVPYLVEVVVVLWHPLRVVDEAAGVRWRKGKQFNSDSRTKFVICNMYATMVF